MAGAIAGELGDRAFVTFRYAADANRAVAAFRERSMLARCCGRPPSWYHPDLQVESSPPKCSRAPCLG